VHVVVCVKEIPDPEIASSLFKVDEAARKVIPVPGLPMVISPFDEQAVEAALRIKDKADADAVTITILTLGPESALTILKGALSMGADEGVHLCDAALEGADSYATAVALTHAILKIGDHDLILTGRQAADWDAGVVGCGIAELLDIPAVTLAKDVQVDGPVVRVERVAGDGVEVVKAPLPAVVTVAHELGQPRKASLRETMRTAQKPVAVWSAADLGLAAGQVGEAGSRRTRERLYAPVSDIFCEFIEGETPQQQAAALAHRLHEDGLV